MQSIQYILSLLNDCYNQGVDAANSMRVHTNGLSELWWLPDRARSWDWAGSELSPNTGSSSSAIFGRMSFRLICINRNSFGLRKYGINFLGPLICCLDTFWSHMCVFHRIGPDVAVAFTADRIKLHDAWTQTTTQLYSRGLGFSKHFYDSFSGTFSTCYLGPKEW